MLGGAWGPSHRCLPFQIWAWVALLLTLSAPLCGGISPSRPQGSVVKFLKFQGLGEGCREEQDQQVLTWGMMVS